VIIFWLLVGVSMNEIANRPGNHVVELVIVFVGALAVERVIKRLIAKIE